jgi:hypothetical protein
VITYLPAYAPKLNPEEQRNAWAKGAVANALPGSVDDLAAHARHSFQLLSSCRTPMLSDIGDGH